MDHRLKNVRRTLLVTALTAALASLPAATSYANGNVSPSGDALAAQASSAASAAAADPASEASGDSTSNPLDAIEVTADTTSVRKISPSQGSLLATEPQSIVNGQFIQDTQAPMANYTDIVKFTPSVWSLDPNGPGLMENLGLSIRGFQDGQFNVTFDGIPWGDSNDFTHHSTSYFMPQDIGAIVVDRGPGNAATIGDATFGGTVAVQSAAPKPQTTETGSFSAGSFGTFLSGARFDTGTVSAWGGTQAFVDVKYLTSDGYLSNANLDRSNAFVKIVQPVSDATTLTFVSNLNSLTQNPPIGATAAQIAQFGPNYAYNTDPNSQAFYGYNLDKISTDYEYIGLLTDLDGWKLDNKLYTYEYNHTGFNGEDPNGETPNGTLYGPNNVPGQKLINDYRSVGDIVRATHDLGPGAVQAGLWYDRQDNHRALYEIDFSNNQAFNPAALGNTDPTPQMSADRIMADTLYTTQGYLQYQWHATDALDVTGGVKYVNFERSLNAPVNQKTLLPLTYDETWVRSLPSLDVHYRIQDGWAAYVQWAKGFLAPNLNILYTTDPSQSDVQPEGTTNVQLGMTWASDDFTFAADVYSIDFDNEIAHRKVGTITVFFNEGATKYRGVEAEATYALGGGLSVYGNASVNSAKQQSDQTWVPDTPNRTAALGLLYRSGPLNASLMTKYVGVRYGDTGNSFRLGGYATTDASIDYSFDHPLAMLKNVKLGLTAQNLADRTSIYDLAGYTGALGTPLYFTIPGRSYQATISASF